MTLADWGEAAFLFLARKFLTFLMKQGPVMMRNMISVATEMYVAMGDPGESPLLLTTMMPVKLLWSALISSTCPVWMALDAPHNKECEAGWHWLALVGLYSFLESWHVV